MLPLQPDNFVCDSTFIVEFVYAARFSYAIAYHVWNANTAPYQSHTQDNHNHD